MVQRHEKMKALFKKLTSEFVRTAAPRGSLVTVTDLILSPSMEDAHVFLSVYPQSEEKQTMHFLTSKKQEWELNKSLKQNTKIKRLPKIFFKIDKGEKNRQRIDELLRRDNE